MIQDQHCKGHHVIRWILIHRTQHRYIIICEFSAKFQFVETKIKKNDHSRSWFIEKLVDCYLYWLFCFLSSSLLLDATVFLQMHRISPAILDNKVSQKDTHTQTNRWVNRLRRSQTLNADSCSPVHVAYQICAHNTVIEWMLIYREKQGVRKAWREQTQTNHIPDYRECKSNTGNTHTEKWTTLY